MTKEASVVAIKRIVQMYEDGAILYDEMINDLYAHLVEAVDSCDYKASVSDHAELDPEWANLPAIKIYIPEEEKE